MLHAMCSSNLWLSVGHTHIAPLDMSNNGKQQQQQQPSTPESNLVKDGAVIASTVKAVPMFGKVELSRGSLSVSDRWGRSVMAITARVPLSNTGIVHVVNVYGRLDDKTGKITYAPSLSNKTYQDEQPGAMDRLKGHIIGAIKTWPDWDATRKAADHACRFGKVKVKVKNADGVDEDMDTSLESEPEPAPKTEQPATSL